MENPKMVMKTHPITHSIERPVILLKKRNNEVIGCINYSELKMKLSGSGPDEISFKVYHETDSDICTFWDEIIDLKIVDVVGYGRFEISLQKVTDTSNLKIVTCRSLEVELAQIPIYELHINDDDYFTYGIEDENNLDSYGNIKPIKIYNPSDPDHSLLHLLLADKACHWQIGVVPEYITVTNDGKQEKELFTSFQRTFTIDGKDIYSFLTEELAPEANLVYVFDTYNRRINIYDQYEIGEDTTVFINNRNLANTITVDDNADSLKNCFKIVGGDDVITNYLSAVNMTGNYIWGFSDIQLKDMPKGLADAIKSYMTYKGSLTGKYNEIFKKLCAAYDKKSYLESSMMPSVELKDTTAKEQITNMEHEFHNTQIGVSNLSIFNPSSFTGITNNIIAYGKALTDNRYTVESIDDITGNYPRYNGVTWTGKIHIYRITDKTDSSTEIVSVKVNDDALNFTKQKILKALAKDGMYDVDLDVLAYTTSADYSKLVNYFQKYSLNRLKSFYDGYEACLAILTGPQVLNNNSSIFDPLYSTYKLRRDAVYDVYQIREKEVEQQDKVIEQIEAEMKSIQASADFKSYLDKIDKSYWKLFNSYRREDVYQNDNYVSDGLTDGEILAKCKELLDYAQYQLSMACQLQRTCTVDLNNMLVMDEFKPFWDKFAIYNYIRVETDNEILKLRLMDIDIDFDNIDKLNVTFAENISGNGNVLNDIPSIIKQASSIASSYNSTKLQSSQGKKAFNQVGNWIAEGLKAAQTTIANSDNNQVTLNNYGILLKSMTEEGNYGDFQTKIIGEGIYFTQDNWKSVSCALGTIYIDGELTSGIIAQNIIGKLIAGETLFITNDSGSVKIDGDTAKFTDITIDYVDKNGNRVKIGGASDRIFSISSNGSEVLYFNNVSNKMVMTGTLVGCDGDFSGTLTACNMSASNITGTNINGSTITGSTVKAGHVDGNTITGGTIKIGDGFYVDESGHLTSVDGNFTGYIHAGTRIDSPNIYGGYIYGASQINVGGSNGSWKATIDENGNIWGQNGHFDGSLYCVSLGVGNQFSVDNIGNLNGTNGSFNGDITAINFNGAYFDGSIYKGNSFNGNNLNIGNYVSGIYKFTVNANGEMSASKGLFDLDVQADDFYAGDSYYIKDHGQNIKIISSWSASASNTKYAFGRLNDNGYGGDLNYITFENSGSKRTCFVNSGSMETACPIKITGDYSFHTTSLGGGLYNDVGSQAGNGGGRLIIFGSKNDSSNKMVHVGNELHITSIYSSGEISVNGSSSSHLKKESSSSDKRLKEHISDLSQFDDFFMSLNPVCFKYHDGLYNEAGKIPEMKWGFYAQDIVSAFKKNGLNWHDYGIVVKETTDISQEERKYIDETCDGILKVNYQEFTALNTNMIQKVYQKTSGLQNNMLSLQGQLLSLQCENTILRQRLDRLEELLSA